MWQYKNWQVNQNLSRPWTVCDSELDLKNVVSSDEIVDLTKTETETPSVIDLTNTDDTYRGSVAAENYTYPVNRNVKICIFHRKCVKNNKG